MWRRRLRGPALLAVVALAGAGCSEGRAPAVDGAPPPTEVPFPTAPPAAEVAPASGAHHPLGAKWDLPGTERYAPFLSRLSGGATFFELVWCDIERREGTRDWSRPDGVADIADRLGFQLKLKIRVGSCWATGGLKSDPRGRRQKTVSATPDDPAAYEAFVRAVVERYAARGIHDYAVENEVNASNFWTEGGDAYEALAERAAPVIRAADPQARVFDSGISSTGYGVAIAEWLLEEGRDEDALDAYNRYYDRRGHRGADFPAASSVADVRAALRTDAASRALDTLAATFRLVQSGVVDAYQLHFYERWDSVPLLLEFLRAHLPGTVPVEAWETGVFWRDGDEERAADEVARTVALLLAGGVQRVIYLPMSFSEGGRQDSEVRWGLLGPAGEERPAGRLWAELAQAAGGGDVRPVGGDGFEGVVAGDEGATMVIAWATGAAVRLPVPAGTRARTVMGDDVTVSGGDVRVDDESVVLRIPEGIDAFLARVGTGG